MSNPFQDLFQGQDRDPEYLAGLERMRFTYRIGEAMQAKGISRSQLAAKLSVSPAYITQVLRAESNFTLETMMKLALAVDHGIRVELFPLPGEYDIDQRCPECGTQLSGKQSEEPDLVLEHEPCPGRPESR